MLSVFGIGVLTSMPLVAAAASQNAGRAIDVLIGLPPHDQAIVLEDLNSELQLIGSPKSGFIRLLDTNVEALRLGERSEPEAKLLEALNDHDDLLWGLILNFERSHWPHHRERAQKLISKLAGLQKSYRLWSQKREEHLRQESVQDGERQRFPGGMVNLLQEARDLMVFLGKEGSEIIGLLEEFQDVTEALTVSGDITQQALARQEAIAIRDPLTGLLTRKALMTMLKEKMERRIEKGSDTIADCWVLMADIDRFKRVNDTHGHSAGDKVLEYVSHKLRQEQTLRKRDLVSRWGGEEFLIVFDGISDERAKKLAERLRRAIEREPIYVDDNEGQRQKVPVTISIGMTRFRLQHNGEDLTAQIQASFERAQKQADEALYEAKETGRNRVVIMDS